MNLFRQKIYSLFYSWIKKDISTPAILLIALLILPYSQTQASKKINFSTLPNHTLSPMTGWTRGHIEEAFYVLMNGIIASASEGGARQRIPGPQSHHGQIADEMEGFTRSFFMAGAWLHGSTAGSFTYKGTTTNVAQFYKRGILAGTDPHSKEYWGPIPDYGQQLVECAALGWSLFLSKKHIWDTYSDLEKKQIGDFLFQCTKAKYYNNNWLLFNLITNTALKKLGMPFSQEQIDKNIQACNGMYIGGGWYRDGSINRIDYYNAWGFLNYYMMWVIMDGDSKPEIAEIHKQRTREFVRDFQYFFSGDGSTPCFGRSMIYRFGYLAPVVLGQITKSLETDPGIVKTMINSGMKFFFDKEILTDDDHLSLGYIRPNMRILENYSCGGSPYWAVKAFSILMLPESDPFWQVQEKPLPIQKASYSYPIKAAGLLLVGDKQSGHVQLINQKSYHDLSSYNDKYTHFAYSSIFTYEAGLISGSFNCDNILQYSEDGKQFYQRWEMENLYTVKDFSASKYPLDKIDKYGTAFTSIIVKDDYMINFHQIETQKSLYFREGGYPLGFDEGMPKIESSDFSEAVSIDGRMSYIRNLYGYAQLPKETSLLKQTSRTNVRYNESVVPMLTYENREKKKFYIASMVYGKLGECSKKEFDQLVKSFRVDGNTATMEFYDGEQAFLQIGDIQNVAVDLNRKKLSGQIVVARVSADGKKWFVLNRKGKIDCNE